MRVGLVVGMGLLALSACRTEIAPVVKAAPTPKIFKGPPGQCAVHDYTSATDVPSGSKNLGWVQVKKADTDEATYEVLREAICNQGGDALSQLAWVREVGDYEPTALKANAWVLPDR